MNHLPAILWLESSTWAYTWVLCELYFFNLILKFPFALFLRMFARKRKPTYWDYSINCTGNEAHLSSCKLGHTLTIKANSTCEQGTPVVVSCVPGRAFAPTPMAGYRKAFRQEVRPDDTFIPRIKEATCLHEVLLCTELLTLTIEKTIKYGTELNTLYQHGDSKS